MSDKKRKSIGCGGCLTFFIALGIIGVAAGKIMRAVKGEDSPSSSKTTSAPKLPAAPAPQHTVLESDLSPVKCSFKVMLPEAIEREDLIKVASSVGQRCAHQNAFTNYWLAGQNVGKDAPWAVTTHKPAIKITRIGSTPSDLAKAKEAKQSENLIGVWHDSLIKRTVALEKAKGGKARLTYTYEDGSTKKHTLRPHRSKGKQAWKSETWNPHRDWIRINDRGQLEIGAKNKVIRKLSRAN